jgi:two-component system alkaline phosphatase synthesis response regulator PhoP
MDESPILSEKTILLADNEQFIAVAYKDGLERAGYKVIVAQDGEEALVKLKSSKPDLLLLELLMPKVNGFEVLQAMKDDSSLKDIPVLVLTNLAQESDEAEARSYGIVDFMVKADISLRDLTMRIQEILGPTLPVEEA